MSTGAGDRLVADYLQRLERATAGLPPGTGADLLREIREHIADARAAGGTGDRADDEAGVRTVLERLGDPEEIAAAAGGDVAAAPTAAPVAAALPRPVNREVWAVLFLTAGSVLVPGVGWLVGVVLLWSSDLWRSREKWVGTLVVPGGLGLIWAAALVGVFTAGSSEFCTSPATAVGADSSPPQTCTTDDAGWTPWLVLPTFALLLLAALIVPLALMGIARRRAMEQSHVRSPSVAVAA